MSRQVDVFENIANDCAAEFYEVYIEIQKEDAISRLLKRGVWGEEGSPQLTEADRPEITGLYETMGKAMIKRKNVKAIISEAGDREGTYQKFLTVIR